MRLYLMRHAEAVEPGDWSGSDKTRPLTPAGLAKLSVAVSHMRRLKLSADTLLSSPYLRATQTADVLAEELHFLQSQHCPELAAGARLDAFNAVIKRQAGDASLWIVGHMPEMAVFASRVLNSPRELERVFQPGEILAVDCDIEGGAIAGGREVWRRRLDEWSAVPV